MLGGKRAVVGWMPILSCYDRQESVLVRIQQVDDVADYFIASWNSQRTIWRKKVVLEINNNKR